MLARSWASERFILDLMQALSSANRPAAIKALLEAQVVKVDEDRRFVSVQVSSQGHLLALRSAIFVIQPVLRAHQLAELTLAEPSGAAIKISANSIWSPRKVTHDNQYRVLLTGVEMNRTLHAVVGEMLEFPDRPYGLVNALTEQQVGLSEASGRVILGDQLDVLTPAEVQARLALATRKKREDYFWLPDLEDFRRDIKMLEANSASSNIELRSRMRALDGNWYEYAHRYRLVEGVDGKFFHFGQSLGIKPVPVPAG